MDYREINTGNPLTDVIIWLGSQSITLEKVNISGSEIFKVKLKKIISFLEQLKSELRPESGADNISVMYLKSAIDELKTVLNTQSENPSGSFKRSKKKIEKFNEYLREIGRYHLINQIVEDIQLGDSVLRTIQEPATALKKQDNIRTIKTAGNEKEKTLENNQQLITHDKIEKAIEELIAIEPDNIDLGGYPSKVGQVRV